MANLDTRDKRSSSVNFGMPWNGTFPTPDGSDADTDVQRAQITHSYAGISFGMFVPPVVEVPQGKNDGGAGRRKPDGEPWWTGEWITPGVDSYLPEAPPEDVTPLRPQVEELRDRLRVVKPPKEDPEYLELMEKVGALGTLVLELERLSLEVMTEAAIQEIVEQYRRLAARRAAIEAEVAEMEARERWRQYVVAEDEEIIQIIAEAL